MEKKKQNFRLGAENGINHDVHVRCHLHHNSTSQESKKEGRRKPEHGFATVPDREGCQFPKCSCGRGLRGFRNRIPRYHPSWLPLPDRRLSNYRHERSRCNIRTLLCPAGRPEAVSQSRQRKLRYLEKFRWVLKSWHPVSPLGWTDWNGWFTARTVYSLSTLRCMRITIIGGQCWPRCWKCWHYVDYMKDQNVLWWATGNAISHWSV